MSFAVLLVDDEEEFIRTLAERLQIRGLSVQIALDGEQALRIVQESPPDIMVVDLKMPGMDGMMVLSRVRQIAPRVKIIMLTGHGSESDKEKAQRLGVFEYLQKPIDINTLLGTMKRGYESARGEMGI